MEIAKRITSADYQKLALDDPASKDWDKAIGFLQARLNERYLEPIRVLLEYEESKQLSERMFGFTILAIDCLLIETLQSFYEGKGDSTKLSKKLFMNFLMERIEFKKFFTWKQAEDFYYDFRCGLLHQAQTFRNTRIWIIGELIERTNTEVSVNRILFHEAVKKEIDRYLSLLAKAENELIRKNFKTKMNYIVTEM